MMKFDNVYFLPASLREEDFFRSVLLRLTTDSDTTPDVADITFGEVKRCDCEIVYGKLHLETDATANVGYDRQEQYQEKVRKYDSDAKRFYDDWEWKTRTVTDWHPFSTHCSEDAVGAGLNRDDRKNDRLRESLFRNYTLQAMVEKAKENAALKPMIATEGERKVDGSGRIPTPTAFGEEDLKRETRPYINYPGDHVQNISEHCTKEILFTDCYILPVYEVEFEYRGAKYRAIGFALEDGRIAVDIPPTPERKDPGDIALKKTRPLKIAFILSWIFCGAAVASQIAVFYFGINWVGYLAIVGYALAVTLHIIRNLIYDRIVKAETADIATAKQLATESTLSKRGYPRLTEKERERFKDLSSVGSTQKSDYKLTSPYARAFVIAIILALVLGIFMGAAAWRKNDMEEERIAAQEAALYTISQASAQVMNISSSYKDSGFNYGYYVDFTLEIQAKSVAISGVRVEINVYYAGESSVIGVVTANLSGLHLSAGQKTTESVSLGSGNQVFNALYGNNASSFRFEVKITQINFENGRTAS